MDNIKSGSGQCMQKWTFGDGYLAEEGAIIMGARIGVNKVAFMEETIKQPFKTPGHIILTYNTM